jgi:hypothetical protein
VEGRADGNGSGQPRYGRRDIERLDRHTVLRIAGRTISSVNGKPQAAVLSDLPTPAACRLTTGGERTTANTELVSPAFLTPQ